MSFLDIWCDWTYEQDAKKADKVLADPNASKEEKEKAEKLKKEYAKNQYIQAWHDASMK